MNNLRILHIGEYVQGGVATYIKTLITHSRTGGLDEFLVLADAKSDHSWSLDPNHVFFYSYRRSFLNIIPAMRFIQNVITQVKPDVIYCHSTWAGVLGRFPFFFKKKRMRILYNAHGWAFTQDTSDWKKHLYAWVERLLAVRTDWIINVSQYEMRSAISYGIPETKMKRIYSGISSHREEVQERSPFDSSRINLLFVGRLDPQKGVDLLLSAMQNLARKDVHLTLIGDSVLGGKKISVADMDNVSSLGWISHDELPRYYFHCDAVVIPSRWEAFGLVAIEAMKYGKPVLVSPNGALPELVFSNINGYVINFNNSNALNIVDLNKEKLRTMGEQAEKIFHQKFDSTKMCQETRELYDAN